MNFKEELKKQYEKNMEAVEQSKMAVQFDAFDQSYLFPARNKYKMRPIEFKTVSNDKDIQRSKFIISAIKEHLREYVLLTGSLCIIIEVFFGIGLIPASLFLYSLYKIKSYTY